MANAHKSDKSEVIVILVEASCLRLIWVEAWDCPRSFWVCHRQVKLFSKVSEKDLSVISAADPVGVSAVVNNTIAFRNEESIGITHVCKISSLVLILIWVRHFRGLKELTSRV